MHVYVSICVCTVFLKKKIHGTQPNLSRLKIWGPQPSQLDNESYVRVLLYLQLADHFLLISVKVIIVLLNYYGERRQGQFYLRINMLNLNRLLRCILSSICSYIRIYFGTKHTYILACIISTQANVANSSFSLEPLSRVSYKNLGIAQTLDPKSIVFACNVSYGELYLGSQYPQISVVS
jgi:hypothetical protein